MSGYKTRNLDVNVGALTLHLRALKDRAQFYDPDGAASKAGICSASWSIFGQFWQASMVLANVVKKIDLKDRRFIELGCGLALPSLILQSRGADITASDYHPLSKSFLDHNATLNKLARIPHVNLSWTKPDKNIGEFDVIIASDVLYEPHHADLLADVIDEIAAAKAKVLITCPGRGYRNKLSRLLSKQGFQLTETRLAFDANETPPYAGRLLSYLRA